jgi:hypothetical protein
MSFFKVKFINSRERVASRHGQFYLNSTFDSTIAFISSYEVRLFTMVAIVRIIFFIVGFEMTLIDILSNHVVRI